MRQLTQKLGKGDIEIIEVPVPGLGPGYVLVRNHFSLISAGTEGSTVKTARKSLIGKAKERPQQVRQVLEVLRSQGIVQTYRAVVKKLDAYSPLGYSCAGQVIDVGEGVEDLAVGDFVACGGVTASHAEVVSVPNNLAVRLAPDADLRKACYNTLGAIALQGVRQADLRVGESCVIIGLGLIGQLTALLLRAAGVATYGVDIDAHTAETAARHCCDDAWARSESGIAERVAQMTSGIGADAVIITAGTSSTDPINFAGEVCRKRGRVIVVGAVPTGFDRDPHWYRKELELRMSCSYGPGRYDPVYEEHGIDYPAPYVRWTERRNMEAFQKLVHSGRIDLGYLTTHEFTLADAAEAYETILDSSRRALGVVLGYDVQRAVERTPLVLGSAKSATKIGLGFVGAGSYAQSNLLPNLPTDGGIARRGVLTNSGATSRRVAEKFGFEFAASDAGQIFGHSGIDAVFVATRHDSHADYVLQAIRASKHVFVEKPLCLDLADLLEIESELRKAEEEGRARQLMVGFNRRFAPLARELSSQLGPGPMAMTYRINAGAIEKESWIQDRKLGGGRIIGEGCHFIDLLTWLNGSLPTTVHAQALPDPAGLTDTVSISLGFENGSIGTVHYFANGSKAMPKESLEVFQAGQSHRLVDYRVLESYRGKNVRRRKLPVQDKGQKPMVRQFVDRVLNGGEPLVPWGAIRAVHAACFAVGESLRNDAAVRLRS